MEKPSAEEQLNAECDRVRYGDWNGQDRSRTADLLRRHAQRLT